MPDFSELLELVDECLEKKHQPDLELVKKHNADTLNKDYQIKVGERGERTDVVHDILAFLAVAHFRNRHAFYNLSTFNQLLSRFW